MGQRLHVSQKREDLITLKFSELYAQVAADLQKKVREKLKKTLVNAWFHLLNLSCKKWTFRGTTGY